MEIFDPKKHWFVVIYARDEYYLKEMYKLVNNGFLYSQEDLAIQNRYRELFPPDHFRINIKTHICTSFLKRHHKLLN